MLLIMIVTIASLILWAVALDADWHETDLGIRLGKGVENNFLAKRIGKPAATAILDGPFVGGLIWSMITVNVTGLVALSIVMIVIAGLHLRGAYRWSLLISGKFDPNAPKSALQKFLGF